MISNVLASIHNKYPESGESIASILQLDARAQRISLEPFFEPISATILSRGKQRLAQVRASDLASWVQHISQGTYCRLRALEAPVVENLGGGRVLAAITLLRAHLEAAALAAYCLDQLTSSIRTNNMEEMAELIPKTLFGTSMQKHRERPAIADLLTVFEGDTIRLCRAIEALDRYYYGEFADGQIPKAYSLLCEFAHPNHRGIMHLMSADERPEGWVITYRAEEHPEAMAIPKALEILLVSMRSGYSAGELLRCWRFDDRTGRVVSRGPAENEAARIWQDFLQGPIGAA